MYQFSLVRFNIQEERAYIEASIPAVSAADKKLFPDLKKLATSLPFLSIVIYHMAHNYGFYALMNGVPTYLNNIHHFSLKQVKCLLGH